MGMDEALLRTAAEQGVATLRLYAWDGPWLSLGYGQRRVDPQRLAVWRAAGVGVVRRTTGGRAVLHGRDLSYSIAAPEGALRPGLRSAYDQLAGALLEAIRALGASQAARVPLHRGARASNAFDCFAAPAGDEIVVGREKLVGSAQRRRAGVVLQHGSIRISADPPAVVAAAGVDAGAAIDLSRLGIEAGEAALRKALIVSFARALGACFESVAASARELELARQRGEMHRLDPLSAPRAQVA